MASIARRDRDRPAVAVAEVHRSRRTRWLGCAFIFWAVGLGAWSAWLTVTLPNRHLAPNWNIAWGGIDVLMAVALLATGITAQRGSALFPMCAGATAALRIVDAALDILTTPPGDQLAA